MLRRSDRRSGRAATRPSTIRARPRRRAPRRSTVGPGEEKGGIDFQYQVVPIARIEGIVTSTGTPAAGERSGIARPAGFAVPGIFQEAHARTHRARSRFPTCRRASTRSLPAPRSADRPRRWAAARGRGQVACRPRRARRRAVAAASAPADQIRLWATADVTVDGRNVSNVVLALQPGMAVSGRVDVRGDAAPPPTDLTRVRVTLSPVADARCAGRGHRRGRARVDADGRFTVASVVPGRTLDRIGASSGWSLGSPS